MSYYGNSYLYEIRQRAANVYQGFNDQYIGENHICFEVCQKESVLKIRAINKKQLRALEYFLYTFTPEKVINLIDNILKTDETMEELNEKIASLKEEADWLATQLVDAAVDDNIPILRGKAEWREAARKAVEAPQCKSN